MSDAIIEAIENEQKRSDLQEPAVGDTVRVDTRITEGSKERIQAFTGVVIRKNGGGLTKTFTVRRIVANEGVERCFPLHSPRIADIQIQRHGDARRSRLYFLRNRVGKARRLRDRRRGLKSTVLTKSGKKRNAANENAN